MEIYGDPKYSNKFYVYLDDGSISWVPSFSIAKENVSNTRNKDWYDKPLYCTTEEVAIGYNGKVYIKSQLPEDPNKIETFDNLNNFKTQSLRYIEDKVNEYIEENEFKSLFDVISWKDSTFKDYKEKAEKVMLYRDKIYSFYENFIKEHMSELNISDKPVDLSNLFDKFINDCPLE